MSYHLNKNLLVKSCIAKYEAKTNLILTYKSRHIVPTNRPDLLYPHPLRSRTPDQVVDPSCWTPTDTRVFWSVDATRGLSPIAHQFWHISLAIFPAMLMTYFLSDVIPQRNSKHNPLDRLSSDHELPYIMTVQVTSLFQLLTFARTFPNSCSGWRASYKTI